MGFTPLFWKLVIGIFLFVVYMYALSLYPAPVFLSSIFLVALYIAFLHNKIKKLKQEDEPVKDEINTLQMFRDIVKPKLTHGANRSIQLNTTSNSKNLTSEPPRAIPYITDPIVSSTVTEASEPKEPPKPRKRTVEDELKKIDEMLDGHDFEHYIGDLMEKLGYENVEVTKGSGDFGVDVLAEKNKIKYAVQCKRFSQNVGIAAVQEVYSGIAYYHCHVGIVATNQYFTDAAKKHADQISVILWDRDELRKMLKIVDLDLADESETEDMEEPPPIPESESFAWPSINNMQIDVEEPIEPIDTQDLESSIQIDADSAFLTAGEYIGGEDIEPGQYVITAIKNWGLLRVYHKGEKKPQIDTFLSPEKKKDNINQYRVNIKNGDRIVISGFEAKISKAQAINFIR